MRWPIFHYYSTFTFPHLFPLPLHFAHIDEQENLYIHPLYCSCCAGVGEGCFCIEIFAKILCRKMSIVQYKKFFSYTSSFLERNPKSAMTKFSTELHSFSIPSRVNECGKIDKISQDTREIVATSPKEISKI